MFLKNINTIFSNKIKAAWCIFIIALVIRLGYSFLYFQNYTESDGVDYHNLAVNVVSGNGYSKMTEPPYEPYFWREPAYPLFLASIYCVYDLFGELHHLQSNRFEIREYPEIRWARAGQAIIGAATCVIFFLTLCLLLKPSLAAVIALLFSGYLPLVAYSSMLMRETLQTFAVIGMSYSFARFLLSKQIRWLLFFSLAWAVSNMSLQITIFAVGFVFLFCWFWLKSIRKSIAYTAIATAVMTAAISPWLIRSYVHHPDIRVVKSLGVSLTYEIATYISWHLQLYKNGEITQAEFRQKYHELKAIPEEEKFALSFAGFFQPQTTPEKPQYLSMLKSVFDVSKLRRGWIESLWVKETEEGRLHLRPHSVYLENKNYLWFSLSLIGFVFGYMAFVGIALFYRQLTPALLMFWFFAFFIPVLAGAARRTLPVHAFIFMFSCLAIYYLFQRLLKKKSHQAILTEVFAASEAQLRILR